MVTVVPPTEEGIARAVQCLRSSGIVAYPTESYYGLGALLSSAEALDRLSALKGRPADQPFPVLVQDRAAAEALLGELKDAAAAAADAAWPGGLTLVAPPLGRWPAEVVSALGMGVRVSAHPAAKALARALGEPFTSTSANLHGRPPATAAEQVTELCGDRVDLVLDGGRTWGRPASTVAVPRAWGLEILREGDFEVPPEQRVTRDAILRGRVTVLQPFKGYRFSVDALLVAHFAARLDIATRLDIAARQNRPLRVADLGTGCGVVALAFRYWNPDAHLTGIELQRRLAALAGLNVEVNNQGSHIRILEADVRAFSSPAGSGVSDPAGLSDPAGRRDSAGPSDPAGLSGLAGSFDLAVSNPPFRAVDTGRPSADPERAAAVSEQTLTVTELASALAVLLAPGGVAAVVYPADRFAELSDALIASGLQPFVARPVHPKAGSGALRMLVAAERTDTARPLSFEEPLVLKDPTGNDAEALRAILEGVNP